MNSSVHFKVLLLAGMLFFLLGHQSFAQSGMQSALKRDAFCHSKLNDSLTSALKQELADLEKLYINTGLLADSSGESYYQVFRKIAKAGDLEFELEKSFPILEGLDFKVRSQCYYKVLTDDELKQLSEKHLAALVAVYQNLPTHISPDVIAQRLTEHLEISDFDLAFFKVASLITLHELSTPFQIDGLTRAVNPDQPNIQDTLIIHLNYEDKILVNEQLSSIDQIQYKMDSFLSPDYRSIGIMLKADRGSSYERYVALINAINHRYKTLRNELALKKFDSDFDQLTDSQKEEIRTLIPANIIFKNGSD